MPATKTVLHVDDGHDDLFLFQKACSQAGVSYQLQVVESGKSAIDYLQGAGRYANRSTFAIPDLVLLDLKMPIPDGFGVLRWMRDQRPLIGTKVCVFTSSFQFEDIKTAYDLGAHCFLTKPAAFESLVAIAGAIDKFLASSRLEVLKQLPEYRQ